METHARPMLARKKLDVNHSVAYAYVKHAYRLGRTTWISVSMT
jgi:hypothetical protein